VRGLAVALACAALWAPAPAAARQAVRSVRVVVDLSDGTGTAAVRAEYVLSGVGADSVVRGTALDFAGATIEALRAGEDGRPLPILRPRALVTLARLPLTPGAAGEGSVVVSYEVPGAVVVRGAAIRGHVPVLSLDLPPEATSPGLFRAELRLPPEWSVAEGFPTGMAPAGAPGVYDVDLAVVPALVGFRGRSDGAWRPGLPLALDAAGLVLLVAFSAVGWRHLRDGAS
jgi:hypothetical protein